MIIKALPKRDFDALMIEKNLNDSNIDEEKNLYLISINYSDFPDWMPEEAYPHFKEDHSNVLRLFYDDVLQDTQIKIVATGEYATAKAFTKEDSIKVIEFLSKIRMNANTEILVHCKAGKSRSVATAHFISEYFGMNTSLIYTDDEMKPNLTVLNLLRQEAPKKCPKCKSDFKCRAIEKISNAEIKCWCQSIKIPDDTLKDLADEFNYKCLCPSCLTEYET